MSNKVNDQIAFQRLHHRAGRMVKYKGEVASIAPFDLAPAIVLPLLSRTPALLSTLAIIMASLGGTATAGTCIRPTEANNIFTCSGAADSTSDEKQFHNNTKMKVTTEPGFGINVIEKGTPAFELLTKEGLIFTDENKSSITGARDGVWYLNFNGGSVNIKSNGTIIGRDEDGIEAKSSDANANAGADATLLAEMTIDVVDVTGGDNGIFAQNAGGATKPGGVLTIKSSGKLKGNKVPTQSTDTGGNGVWAINDGSDMIIDVVEAMGGHSGILAENNGSGMLVIKASGTVTATTGNGIDATNHGTSITIEAVDATGGRAGISADGKGSGEVTIKATGTVISTGTDGIFAHNEGKNLTINAVNVTGEGNGIFTENKGVGELKITTTGDVVGTGVANAYSGFGIHAGSTNVAGGDTEVNVQGSVTADEDGIYVDHRGTGETRVVVTGEVTAGVEGGDGDNNDLGPLFAVDHGVEIVSKGDATADVGAKITKGKDADSRAVAMQKVGGNSTLILRGGWELVGQAESAVKVDDRLVLVADGLAGETLDLSDIGDATNPNAIIGFANLVKQGNGNWVLTGVQTVGEFTTGKVEAGTLTMDNATLLMLDTATPLHLFEGTTLAVNGTSAIKGSLKNHGTVAMVNGTAGDVLDVSGDYAAASALRMEAVLGDDTSPADLLKVAGNTSGETDVSVINLGGKGAQTVVGIPLVKVGGASDGTFVLANSDFVNAEGQKALIAGPYAYRLVKTSEGDWVLTSERKPDVPVDPIVPPSPSDRALQPAAPVALEYPQNLQLLNRLPDLRARAGQDYRDLLSANAGGKSWARVIGGSIGFNDATSEASLRTRTAKLKFGVDVPLVLSNGAEQVLGLNVWTGSANTDVISIFGDGSINTKGYGVGATATWFFPNEAYLDLQGQYGIYESDLGSNTLGELVTGVGGKGYALSVEGGRSFAMGAAGWKVTPQAQLVWSKVDFDSFITFGGQVEPINTESLQLRTGVAFDREISTGADGATSLLYAQGNLYYELLDHAGINFAETHLISDTDRGQTEIVLGGEHRAAGGKSAIYGDLRLGTGLKSFGDKLNVSANVGLKINF